VILDVQAAYVDRFAPGKLIRVDSPDFMEPAIPPRLFVWTDLRYGRGLGRRGSRWV
jgi:hypothetical protein